MTPKQLFGFVPHPTRIRITYVEGIAIDDVAPKDRAEDVLYYLITRCLKGGRSLEGVTWEVLTKPEVLW